MTIISVHSYLGPVTQGPRGIAIGSEYYYVCRFPDNKTLAIPSSQLVRPNVADERAFAGQWHGEGVEEIGRDLPPIRPMSDEEREDTEDELKEKLPTPVVSCCGYGQGWETSEETDPSVRSVLPIDEPMTAKDYQRDTAYVPRYPGGQYGPYQMRLRDFSEVTEPVFTPTASLSVDRGDPAAVDPRFRARELLELVVRNNPLADSESRSAASAALRSVPPSRSRTPPPEIPPDMAAGAPGEGRDKDPSPPGDSGALSVSGTTVTEQPVVHRRSLSRSPDSRAPSEPEREPSPAPDASMSRAARQQEKIIKTLAPYLANATARQRADWKDSSGMLTRAVKPHIDRYSKQRVSAKAVRSQPGAPGGPQDAEGNARGFIPADVIDPEGLPNRFHGATQFKQFLRALMNDRTPESMTDQMPVDWWEQRIRDAFANPAIAHTNIHPELMLRAPPEEEARLAAFAREMAAVVAPISKKENERLRLVNNEPFWDMNEEALPSLTNDFNTPEMRARLLKFFRAIYVGRTARRMPAATWEPVIRRELENYRDIVQDTAAPESPRTPSVKSVRSTGFDLPPKVTEGSIADSDDDDVPLFTRKRAEELQSARESQPEGEEEVAFADDPAVFKRRRAKHLSAEAYTEWYWGLTREARAKENDKIWGKRVRVFGGKRREDKPRRSVLDNYLEPADSPEPEKDVDQREARLIAAFYSRPLTVPELKRSILAEQKKTGDKAPDGTNEKLQSYIAIWNKWADKPNSPLTKNPDELAIYVVRYAWRYERGMADVERQKEQFENTIEALFGYEVEAEKEVGRATGWQVRVAKQAMRVKNSITRFLHKKATSPQGRDREWDTWMANPNVWVGTNYNETAQIALWALMPQHTRAVKTDIVRFLTGTPEAVEGERGSRHFKEEDLVQHMKRLGITPNKTNEMINENIHDQLEEEFTKFLE